MEEAAGQEAGRSQANIDHDVESGHAEGDEVSSLQAEAEEVNLVEWVETTAKSIEEAKDLALDKLGVDEADAEFEVLEEPRQGLFGRTRGEARVRARVEPKAPRAKEERPRKRRRTKNEGGRGRSKADGGATSATPDAPSPATTPDDGPAASSDDGGQKRQRSRSERGRNRGRGQASGDGRTDEGRRADKKRSEKSERKESSMEEVRTCVDEFLNGLVDAFDIDTSVTIDDSDEQIMATIEGKHGLLLGPKARTLDAIQELTRVTAQRTAPSSIRIKVDVGGYREARRNALVGFAKKAAEKARAEGVDVVLEAMSAADRKVVHDALNDEPGVSTRSAGADPRRYVVVVPDAPATDTAATTEDADADA